MSAGAPWPPCETFSFGHIARFLLLGTLRDNSEQRLATKNHHREKPRTITIWNERRGKGAIKQTKLYSPTRRSADPSLPFADPPTRRFADSSLPLALDQTRSY